MPVKVEPNIGINYGWDAGESGIKLQLDENWKAVGALLQLSVISSTTDVPSTPASGDRYIIPTGATGLWSSHVGKVARFNDSNWEIYAPKTGWEVSVGDTGQTVYFDGTTWQYLSNRHGQYADDTAASSNGVPVGGFYINSSTGALHVRLS